MNISRQWTSRGSRIHFKPRVKALVGEMKFEQIANVTIGNYTFNSCFDSGNLGRVELVKSTADRKLSCDEPRSSLVRSHRISGDAI